MNCEWVEGQLSAYHDHALDADTAAQVAGHLAACARCSAILADYTRNDRLVAGLPRYEPRAELRARIFAAPEFQELLQERAGGRASATTPTPVPDTPVPTASSPARLLRMTRVLTGVAAVLVLVVGAAVVLLRQSSAKPNACTPVASGMHLVFRAAASLHSDTRVLLCDRAATAGGTFSVSPDGRQIAYVDAHSGAVMVINADGANGHSVFDTAGVNVGAARGLVWSPDGTKLAILTTDAAGQHALFVADPAGTGWSGVWADSPLATLAGAPAWSPDDTSLAFALNVSDPSLATGTELAGCAVCLVVRHAVQTQGGATPAGATPTISPADAVIAATPSGAGTVQSFGFSGSLLTWAVTNPAAAQTDLIGAASTAPGAHAPTFLRQGTTPLAVAAPASDAAHDRWAFVTADGTLWQADVATGALKSLAHVGSVAALAWSPDGAQLAVVLSSGALDVLTPTGLRHLADNLAAPSQVLWSPDGSRLAYIAGGAPHILSLALGATPVVAASSLAVQSVAGWSADGRAAAFWGQAGALVLSTTGMTTAFPAALTTPPQWTSVP